LAIAVQSTPRISAAECGDCVVNRRVNVEEAV
jgi:hypothetical protein